MIFRFVRRVAKGCCGLRFEVNALVVLLRVIFPRVRLTWRVPFCQSLGPLCKVESWRFPLSCSDRFAVISPPPIHLRNCIRVPRTPPLNWKRQANRHVSCCVDLNCSCLFDPTALVSPFSIFQVVPNCGGGLPPSLLCSPFSISPKTNI